MEDVKVSEEEKRRLLELVKKTSDESRETTEKARSLMQASASKRAKAVQAALDAGVPRQEIADAAGANKNFLYRITGKTTR